MRDTLSLYRIGARPYLAPRSPCLRALRKSRTMEQIQAISRPASLPDGVEAYWTTPDEVRSSSFGDWFFSHTSYCLPLHHWEGHLTLTQEALVIRGKDKRTWAAVEYRVAPNELEEVYHGYDDVFTRLQERSLGLYFSPLRVRFRQGAEQHTLYLALGYSPLLGSSYNWQWVERLEHWRRRG